MRLIHCADIHLDSKMSSNLDSAAARQRKGELLNTFERMVEYAGAQGIGGILIAGDLFDTRVVSATARNAVLHAITSYPDIIFYYLTGNHERDSFLESIEDIPDNIRTFGSSWTRYDLSDRVTVTGLELSRDNSDSAYLSLVLDADRFNIVMLHGQQAQTGSKDKSAEIISLRDLRNRGIDYLALGHVHAYTEEELDARGFWCYPGCLEGRGFDECGEHGFVVLDIDEKTGTFTRQFVPFAQRRLYTVSVDVSGCMTSAEMLSRCRQRLAEEECDTDSLVKIVLEGSLDVECEKDTEYILSSLRAGFFFTKLYDETVLRVDPADYTLDESLKGEFARLVMADETLSEEDRAEVIRYGIRALAGEEVR